VKRKKTTTRLVSFCNAQSMAQTCESRTSIRSDTIGDLVFDGVASNVFRSDYANGVTGDAAYRIA
jgi:hypothetical protein